MLETGATGYVAGVLISELLDQGLQVHCTVRDPTQRDRLQYLDVANKSNGGSIAFFGADLLTPVAFDKTTKGCGIICHTALPFALSPKDPQTDLT